MWVTSFHWLAWPSVFLSPGLLCLIPPLWSTAAYIVSALSHNVCWSSSLFIRLTNRLAGLVVKASASRMEDPRFASSFRRDFSGSSHTSDFKIGNQVAVLPGAWRYRVSAGTGRSGVNILWLGEVESWIYSFYLSVAAHTIVWADPSLRYTSMWLGREATHQQTLGPPILQRSEVQ